MNLYQLADISDLTADITIWIDIDYADKEKVGKMSEVEVSVSGINGQLEFDGNSVKILRRGLMAKVGHGLKGDKSIPIKMISSIQFKKGGLMANGYIQFATGAGESRGGIYDALKDENSVVFYMGSNDEFENFKDLVEDRINKLHNGGSGGPSPTALIRELKSLLDDGIISQEDFDEKKSKLMKEI